MSSISLNFLFYNSSTFSFFWVSSREKTLEIFKPLFSTCLAFISDYICGLSSNNFFGLLLVSATSLEELCPSVVIEKVLFLTDSKNELIFSKTVTAKSHFLTSERFVGAVDEKVSIFSLISSHSCDFVFACWKSVPVSFSFKKPVHCSIIWTSKIQKNASFRAFNFSKSCSGNVLNQLFSFVRVYYMDFV